MLSKKIILIIIILLAAVLRLWDLGGTPIHLTNDEAALGYNAYSILKTGKDEHGQPFPIIFKSFNDWKPGLYVYATVPLVAIFGLNEFAVRLPGAISGVIAVWLVYLVVQELFRAGSAPAFPPASARHSTSLRAARVSGSLPAVSPTLSMFASFFLAISPWHIHFSRGAWEAGASLTLTLAGIFFFLRAMRDRSNWLFISAVLFGATLITYQGAKLATGIVVFGLVVFWWRKLITISTPKIFLSILIGIFISSPALLSVFTGKAGRLEVFSIFSYRRPEEIVEHIVSQGNETKKSLTYLLFHSEELQFTKGILGRWANHYSTRFLFFEGDWVHLNLSTPRTGVLLFVDIAFIISGIVALSRMKIEPPVLFIAYWFLTAPLPAALSRDTLHAIRSFNLVIPLTVVLASGAVFLWEWVSSLRWHKFLVFSFLVFYFLNFLYWADQYFVHMNVHNARYWQYGYKQVVEKITTLQKNYQQVVVAQSYDQPYIYFLFYQKYSPERYQENGIEPIAGPAGSLDALLIPKLDNISFEFLDWHKDNGRHGALIVGTPVQIPPEDTSDTSRFKVIDEIRYSNGQTAFRMVEIL